MARNVKCPKCRSTNIRVMVKDRKGFSFGKAIGGGLLTGEIGLLAGFVGKKAKYDVFCEDYGHIFRVKQPIAPYRLSTWSLISQPTPSLLIMAGFA